MTKQNASNNTSSNSSNEDLLSLRVAKIINKQETQAGAGAWMNLTSGLGFVVISHNQCSDKNNIKSENRVD